jgi:hypothetical protein
MNNFVEDLKKFEEIERSYSAMYPDATPLSHYYRYFGLHKLINIFRESNGRRIIFKISNDGSCQYRFEEGKYRITA